MNGRVSQLEVVEALPELGNLFFLAPLKLFLRLLVAVTTGIAFGEKSGYRQGGPRCSRHDTFLLQILLGSRKSGLLRPRTRIRC